MSLFILLGKIDDRTAGTQNQMRGDDEKSLIATHQLFYHFSCVFNRVSCIEPTSGQICKCHSLAIISYADSSSLFNLRERKMLQKKNTQLRNNTRSTGGQKAMLTAVAGTHSFQLASMVST